MVTRKRVLCLLIAVMAAAMLVLSGCPKSPEAPAAGPATTATPTAPTTTAAPAEVAEPETEAAEIALTKDIVTNFMTSMNDDEVQGIIEAAGKAMGMKEGEDPDPETVRKMFDALATNTDLEKVVKAHGFGGAGEWVETAEKVMPGLAYGMAVAMCEMLGIEEGSEEFKKMVEDSEFSELEDVFDQPTDEELQTIAEALTESVDEAMKERAGVE